MTDEYLLYVEKFSRNNGQGDLFDSFYKAVNSRIVIPINFNFLGFRNASGEYVENIGLPGISARRFPEHWAAFHILIKDKLPNLIDNLNSIYGQYTENRLRFSLGNFTTHSYNISDFLSSDINFPGDELSDLSLRIVNNLTVRIKPRVITPRASLIDGLEQAQYHSNGVLDIFYNTILKSPVLAHEIGHGFFGYDHHESRKCLMDSFLDQTVDDKFQFCEEDKATLLRLIS